MTQPTPIIEFSTYEEGNQFCYYNQTLITDFTPEMLTSNYWQEKGAITGSAQGRGTTWFLTYTDNDKISHDWVLRHYYRGGIIGKLIKDSYWFDGTSNSRAALEFSLLRHMQTLALPAPKPIAYRVIKKGLSYTADLLSSRITNADDLVAILSQSALSDETWREIGRTIKEFHNHSIYHHDLNSHNILLNDKRQVYLIDFDRGELRTNPVKTSWKQANLSRLKRSFLKEFNKLDVFHFTEAEWNLLMSGYQA